MQFTHNGETYEFQGKYARPCDQDFLSNDGGVLHSDGLWPVNKVRAIVHKVPRYHDFGGLRFRFTTHEPRPLAPGEYGKSSETNSVVSFEWGSGAKYWPLAFVEVL